MADFPVQPMQDYGALINSFGQGQTAMAAQRANTGLVQQQTQQAAMQNQITQARMPFIMRMLHDFSNQTDQSGEQPQPDDAVALPGDTTGKPPVIAGAQPPGAQPDNGPQGDNAAPPPDSGPLSAANLAKVDAALAQRYFVDPKGTAQEQQNMVQTAYSGDKGLQDAATIQRDNGVGSRVAHSQKNANNLYNAMDAVTEAAPNGALFALDAVAHNTAAAIKKQYSDPTEQDGAAPQEREQPPVGVDPQRVAAQRRYLA